MSILSIAMFLTAFSLPSVKPVQWPLWNNYATRFMESTGRIIDPSRDSLTTSEGQSYAMFFALVANDHERFDRLYQWTVTHLANGDIKANLPAWSWGRHPDGTLGSLDSNSASDADLWITYDLIQAGRLWNHAEYRNAGQALLSRIAAEEVVEAHGSPVLLPGKTGFAHEESYLVNPSYLPLFLLQAAAHISPQGPWAGLAASLPKLLRENSIHGVAPDWIRITADGATHPATALNSTAPEPVSGYEAIRVYLWAGITALTTPHCDELLQALAPFAEVMKTRSTPPEFTSPTAPFFTGTGPISYSASLIPFLEASDAPQAASLQRRRLQAAWSVQSGLYGNPPQYYDQNLAMFALGYVEHRYRILPNGDLDVPWKK